MLLEKYLRYTTPFQVVEVYYQQLTGYVVLSKIPIGIRSEPVDVYNEPGMGGVGWGCPTLFWGLVFLR